MNSNSLLTVPKLIMDSKSETASFSLEELQIQNKRLSEEVELLKRKQKDSIKQRLKYKKMASRERVPDEDRIRKNYKMLISSISSLQDRTKEIIQTKEENFAKILKFKFENELKKEKDKLSKQKDPHSQVKELVDKLDVMVAKLEVSEQTSENLIRQNKELKHKLKETELENQCLIKKLTAVDETKIGSHPSSPGKPAFLTCSPRPSISEKSLASKLFREIHTVIEQLLVHKHTNDITKTLILCNNRMKQAIKILM